MNTLKSQFVTYEIALKLKGLEFGLIGEYMQLPYFYDLEGNLIINHIGVRRKTIPYQVGAATIDDFEAYLSTTDNSSEDFVLAPLWQQVVDWFREKREISIEIRYEGGLHSDTFEYSYQIFSNYSIPKSEKMKYYKCREQAILKAIELINKE